MEPKKEQTLKDYLIEKILEDHEPDQILIDLIGADLYDLAETELEKQSVNDLKEMV